MTFIEILENSETRAMVDNIEDLISSLRGYDGNEPTLQEMLERSIADLKEATGFEYKYEI